MNTPYELHQPFPNNIDVAQLFLEIQSKKKDVTCADVDLLITI